MSTTLEEQQAAALEAEQAEAPEGAAGTVAPPAPPPGTEAPAERAATRPEAAPSVLRPALATGVMGLGTAFLVGGMFTGVSPRIYAAVGSVAGVALAVYGAVGSRRSKHPSLVQVFSLAGIALAGVMALLTLGPGAVSDLPDLVGQAIKNAKLRRPPAAFEDGWRALIVWALATVGYASAWIGIEMKRPAMGILLPMPVIAFAAIAQPAELQVAGGIVALVAFVVALAVMFRADQGEEGRMPLAFEIKRAARTAPLVIVLVAALVGLGQTDLLFPKPLYDPTQQAVLPKAVPLSETTDRPLFLVRSTARGPWRTGVLDVYDGEAWRIPAFSASKLEPVAQTGVIDQAVKPGAKADFEILGLEGTVLPTATRPAAIVGQLPALVGDARTGTIRVATGQVRKGLKYSLAFGVLPSEAELDKAPTPPPPYAEFLEAPKPPARVARLLEEGSKVPWRRFDAVRRRLLDTVVVTGSGLPTAVPPDRVDDMLFGKKEGTPYEIVAAQALIARWAGVPARVGYGFDGGDETGKAELREIRPKHGSLWPELYFDGYGWLPVTGLPKKAKQSVGSDEQTVAAPLIPSDDIAVDLFLPIKILPGGALLRQVIAVVLLAAMLAAVALTLWTLWPAFVKWRRRSAWRTWAAREGARARIAVAYAQMRDLATDLGVGDPYATPLAFLDLVVPDDEHTELAWLVTRTLWGDLQHDVGPTEVFAAEELSRSLSRRLFEAQPITIRVLSLISRLSLKNPYAPELVADATRARRKSKEEVRHAPAYA